MVHNTDFLTVIIPAYNAGKYIGEAIQSVRNQKFQIQYEIIVVDDGSTDDTALIAGAYADRVVKQEHQGAAVARNKGLELAKGNLVFFLDADDVLVSGIFCRLYNYIQNGNDVVFAMAKDFLSEELSQQERQYLEVRKNPYGGILPGCALLRKDVFEIVGLFDATLRSGETVAWQMKLQNSGMKMVRLNDVSLKRRIHLTNTGRLFRQEELRNYAKVLRDKLKLRK